MAFSSALNLPSTLRLGLRALSDLARAHTAQAKAHTEKVLAAVLDTATDTTATARESLRFARNTGFGWQAVSQSAAQGPWQAGVKAMRMLVPALSPHAQNPSLAYSVAATLYPRKLAVVHTDANGDTQRVTFAELDAAIDTYAEAFRKAGVKKGRPVLLCFKNRPEFFMASAAATRAGSWAVAVSYRSTATELAHLIADAAPALCLCDDDSRGSFDLLANPDAKSCTVHSLDSAAWTELLASCTISAGRKSRKKPKAADSAYVVYTSGTTGKPKGAVRTFAKSSLLSALRIINATPMLASDVHLVACPLYHSTAFAFATLSHVLGNTVVTAPEFSPSLFWQLAREHGVTTTAMVPTMLRRLLAEPHNPEWLQAASKLRVVFSGGAELAPATATAFQERFGDVLWNFYGATETGIVSLASPHDLRVAPGTIGRPLEGVQIRLVDDAGLAVAVGERGELYVKSPMLVSGYHGNEQATSACIRDGFFSVGDVARVDSEGRLFLEGRKRELIISGGVNVYPAEVEAALLEHPQVSGAAVFGVPDEEWGERVCACVMLKPKTKLTIDALETFARDKLSGPKRPKRYALVKELPLGPTGKVNKRLLAAEFCSEFATN